MNEASALAPNITTAVPAPATAAGAAAPVGGTEALFLNFAPIIVIMALFYLFLILPQQRRMRGHAQMLAGLKVGDRVVTNGGLLGEIDSLLGEEEAVVDLGNGVKVTALRSALQARPLPKAANDGPNGKKARKA